MTAWGRAKKPASLSIKLISGLRPEWPGYRHTKGHRARRCPFDPPGSAQVKVSELHVSGK